MKRYGIVPAICSALLLVSVPLDSYAQTAQEQAHAKAKEAIRLEDEEGKFEAAIALLKEAQQLDPMAMKYSYELAYAYQGNKDYAAARSVLQRLLTHKDVDAQVYQMLGNNYDYQGLPDSAVMTYNAGLKKFPDAGELYLELGNMHTAKKEVGKALPYYEKGIEVDPSFASNYYWACIIYATSDDEGWGLLYGELFMNLERNSKRTADISKVLYDTYHEEISITDSSASVSLFKTNFLSAKQAKKGALPFSSVYEIKMTMALVGETAVNLDAIDHIRTHFVDLYYDKKMPGEIYPNVLFEYQQKIIAAGHMSAYNHWLLMKGDETAFLSWKSEHKQEWDNFARWFKDNPLVLTAKHKFYRGMYE